MGVDFRGKGYVRRVRTGKRTVKEGEAVAVWDSHGRHKQVLGPAYVRLWWSTIRFLDRHVAGSREYLRVRHFNGTVEHLRGPAALFENPVYHLGVTVEQAISLDDASQNLVVQRSPVPAGSSQSKGDDKPEDDDAGKGRVVISGPTTFWPEVGDVVRSFKWANEGGGALTQKGRVLSLRSTIVREVTCDARGADGHTASVTVTLRARLLNVAEVLSVTDPIAECDAVAREVVLGAASSVRFSDQAQPLAVALRAAITAPALLDDRLSVELKKRAACHALSVEVGGVTPSAELQKVLNREDDLAAARLKEELADAAIAAAASRQEKEHSLETAKQAHTLRLHAEREAAASKSVDQDAQRALEFLKSLRGMDVDVTRYLCVQGQAPSTGFDVETSRERKQQVAPTAFSRIADASEEKKKPAGIHCGSDGAKKAGGGWW